jgi:hypothetical protein
MCDHKLSWSLSPSPLRTALRPSPELKTVIDGGTISDSVEEFMEILLFGATGMVGRARCAVLPSTLMAFGSLAPEKRPLGSLLEIEADVLPRSPEGRAVRYTLKNWTALTAAAILTSTR